jgi:adenine-specific DNA-methyltransferase
MNRRFIIVQLIENIDKDNKEICKYLRKNNKRLNISEIGKERIRLVGKKIKEENIENENIGKLDFGFKVFKLDTSNIKEWDVNADKLDDNMTMNINNFRDDRTKEDVVFEIMLKYGIDLALPIKEHRVGNNTIYSVGEGVLLICVDTNISLDVADEMIKIKNSLKPEEIRIVFKDDGFVNDETKTNILIKLRKALSDNKNNEIRSI